MSWQPEFDELVRRRMPGVVRKITRIWSRICARPVGRG